MTDRASWWAKKMANPNAPKTPQQPPTYVPVAQPRQQQYQQPQAPAPTGKPENFSQALAMGDALGGAATQSLRNRPGCPECGSSSYTPAKGTTTDHCYECGYTTRFGARHA